VTMDIETPEVEADSMPNYTADTRGLEQRVGYRAGSAGHRAVDSTALFIAEKKAAREAQRASAEPVAQSQVVAQHQAVAQVTSESAEQIDETFASYDEAKAQRETGGSADDSGEASMAGTEVSAVSDMGDQAHVGGSGVTSAASGDNLDVDDVDDDEQVAVERAVKAQAQARAEAEEQAQDSEPEAVLEPVQDDEPDLVALDAPQPEVQAPRNAPPVPQKLLVRRGEPITDAAVVKAKFAFDESGTKQVTDFPQTLLAILRQDLATMTNEAFADSIPVSALVAAYVAAQLGVLNDASDQKKLDANTATALSAFRMADYRTGALEEGLSLLKTMTGELDSKMASLTLKTKQLDGKVSVVENGVAFMVTERVEPTLGSKTPDLMSDKNARVRDRLRKLTYDEIRDEIQRSGRTVR